MASNQRFRIEQWAPHLRREHDIDVVFIPFESPPLTRILYAKGKVLEKAAFVLRDFLRRREVIRLANDVDAVLVLREAALIGPPLYEWLLWKAGAPIVYDFDDAIWTTAKRNTPLMNQSFQSLKFRGKTATICGFASAVTVGNEYLATWARNYNREVHVVPTSIDLDAYPVQAPLAREEPFTVVWSGSFATLEYLELARKPMEDLAKRRSVRLNVICDRPLQRPFSGVETRFIPWKAEEEARAIGTGHVGIMPMPDDEFARGKCGCKALQYMAAGRVAVAAPVGVNADFIRHGENGFVASTDSEWTEVLEHVASMGGRRDSIAAVGRRTVEERFSAQRSAAVFARAVLRAVEQAGSGLRGRPDRRLGFADSGSPRRKASLHETRVPIEARR